MCPVCLVGPVSRCLLSDKKINFDVGATMQICAGATQFAEQTEVNRQEKTVTSHLSILTFGQLSVESGSFWQLNTRFRFGSAKKLTKVYFQ